MRRLLGVKITLFAERAAVLCFTLYASYPNIRWLWKEDRFSRAHRHHPVSPLAPPGLPCTAPALAFPDTGSLSAFHDLRFLRRQRRKWAASLVSNMGGHAEASIPLPLFKLREGSQDNRIERNHMAQNNSCRLLHYMPKKISGEESTEQ